MYNKKYSSMYLVQNLIKKGEIMRMFNYNNFIKKVVVKAYLEMTKNMG